MSKNVELSIYEEDLLNAKNYEKLCVEISEKTNNDSWQFDFMLLNDRNDEPIVDNEDLEKMLAFVKENENLTQISLKLKSMKQRTITTEDTNEANAKLELYDEQMADSSKFPFSINNCEKELDFLYENISNRSKAIGVLKEAKEKILEIPEMSENAKEAMANRFDNLLESLELEGYYKGTFAWNEIELCKKAAARNDWEKALPSMKKAVDYVRPFNIQKMLQLYDLTSKTANAVENEDICLLLGHTGTYVSLCDFLSVTFCVL